MTAKGERFSAKTLFLCSMVFVFACLLLSGGHRLIGSELTRDAACARPTALVRAALACSPAPASQTGDLPQSERHALQRSAPVLGKAHLPAHRVMSDANGNVLGSLSYLRAVHQAFALGDGFV